ncbi:hypothetical protein [Halalkalibacter krulwichiae]|uniref:Lia operon protein LiaI n=1 Tax=Halalkalibacter krulwichiae TaxID=199441 RepID=A0A1X9M6X6_9BACI|nr:hypothetical protein [Halalkalibacter krulwichiae]ARK29178.1 hypothetical protein BkAM31D_04510 [Halalkalibacter krulwichiae]
MNNIGKFIGGVLLMFIGSSILLGMLGINIGGLLGLVIGGCFLYWGYTKYQEKRKWTFSSILLFGLAFVFLLGGLGGVISIAIGALLLYFGYKLLVQNDNDKENTVNVVSTKKSSTYEVIDEEFDRLIKEGGYFNGHDKN